MTAESEFNDPHKRTEALELLGSLVCPRCESDLEGDYCPNCDYRYPVVGGGE